MSRAMIILTRHADRIRAAAWAMKMAWGTRIEFKQAKRTLPQNDRMWAMLSDVAVQADHNGRHYTPDQWKALFMHACGREVQFLPALVGAGFIPWGFHSSDLSVGEMTELIEFMFAWGTEHGVVFNEPEEISNPERDAAIGSGPHPELSPVSSGGAASSPLLASRSGASTARRVR